MKKLILIILTILTTGCTNVHDTIYTTACDPNEVLTVFSKQGTGLVILDVLYDEQRNCSISKQQQELNNNCNSPDRHCSWGY